MSGSNDTHPNGPRQLHFGWGEQDSLVEALARPIHRVSVFVAQPAWGTSAITLWGDDGIGLRICSRMHDVAERIEVGVLEFSWARDVHEKRVFVSLGERFAEINSVLKLVIEESSVFAESGVVVSARSGEEIVIVAGAGPFTLAVKGIEDCGSFDPEYELADYRSETLYSKR